MTKLNYKLWLEKDGKKVFGDGPWDILRRVRDSGSLRQAANEINMSYSQAWKLLNKLEKRLEFDLLNKQAGGSDGGGSKLTEKGQLFVDTFGKFKREAQEKLGGLEESYFDEKFYTKLEID